jgi:hypothetical protein
MDKLELASTLIAVVVASPETMKVDERRPRQSAADMTGREETSSAR